MFAHTTVRTTIEVEAVTITLSPDEAFKLERAAAESTDMRLMDLYTALRDERIRAHKECR